MKMTYQHVDSLELMKRKTGRVGLGTTVGFSKSLGHIGESWDPVSTGRTIASDNGCILAKWMSCSVTRIDGWAENPIEE